MFIRETQSSIINVAGASAMLFGALIAPIASSTPAGHPSAAVVVVVAAVVVVVATVVVVVAAVVVVVVPLPRSKTKVLIRTSSTVNSD